MQFLFRVYHLTTYAVLRLCEFLLRALPLDAAFILGEQGGKLCYYVLRKRRKLGLRNLRLAFGSEMSDEQLEELNREHFRLLGANLFSGLKASTMSHEKLWRRVTANVPDNRAKSGWVALICHMGNWELFSHLGENFPQYRFGAVYQPLTNPLADRHIRETRARSGITLFDRRTEMLRCLRFLKDGGAVGVLVDQGAGYAGLWTPLFGRLTSSSTLAATLAIRTGLPVLPISISTTGRARWEMHFLEAFHPQHDDAELLTSEINRLLEQQIRRSPADWLWAHNRWKPLKPHFLFARDQRRVFLPPDCDPATLDPFRMLLVMPPAAEDPAAPSQAVRAIRKGRPDTWLSVLAPAATASIWRENGDVSHVVEYTDADSPFALAKRISAAADFDAAVFFTPAWKLALAVWLAGIPVRVGRRSAPLSLLYTQRTTESAHALPPVRDYLRMARSIGASIHDPDLLT